MHASQDDDAQSNDLLEVLKARSNFESTSSALQASDLTLSTYSSMITSTIPQCSFEDKDFVIVLAHMGLLFQTFLISYICYISNY